MKDRKSWSTLKTAGGHPIVAIGADADIWVREVGIYNLRTAAERCEEEREKDCEMLHWLGSVIKFVSSSIGINLVLDANLHIILINKVFVELKVNT